MSQWQVSVVNVTEGFLTWRKRRRVRKKQKQKKRHPIIEWIDAFLWAAVVVLLINQYLFQAYQIPTGSMENTLKISDRIFVNKLVYGPELIPGKLKLPGFVSPQRNDVIIFESPTYISKGTLFDILQRVLYMLTLSLVDIDRDETGAPRAHFLIKRAVGVAGDRIRLRAGNVEIRPAGASSWLDERTPGYHESVDFVRRRIIQPIDYPAIRAAMRMATFEDEDLAPLTEDSRVAASVPAIKHDAYERSSVYFSTMHQLRPHTRRYRSEYWRGKIGWYIPDGWIFPMGDNRDNSNDARYFGPVSLSDVLGRGMFIYWPLPRMSRIR